VKGLIVIYYNRQDDMKHDLDGFKRMIWQTNHELMSKITKELGYEFMFVPVIQESSRVEKLEF